MKAKLLKAVCISMLVGLYAAGSALADAPTLQRITANQAFDAVQTQTDPTTHQAKKVVMVDVRTRAEFFWVGAASKVDKITLNDDTTIVPDLGKAYLIDDGRFIMIKQKHWPRLLPVKKIKSVDMSPIAINIPYKLWDEQTAKLYINPDFPAAVEALAQQQGVQVVILFCRSGDRSEASVKSFDNSLFESIYEIDRPDLQNGSGGFEGTSYNNVFLGYRGFPRRDTRMQQAPSVSWKDSALPIKTNVNPLMVNTPTQ
jgi:rhodanese-related sulfurtransferase